MAITERVLVDTSAFYALASRKDVFHDKAKQTYERMVDWHQELWTTSYVLAETFALVHRRLGFGALQGLMEPLLSVLQVLWVDHSIHSEAWNELVARQGEGLGFVDWTTTLAAKRLRASVFTFDQGFQREGVPVFR